MQFNHQKKTTKQNSNPFCTRFTRPGALAFLWHQDISLESLAAIIREHSACQIVGPHGSGKTTLLETLHSFLDQSGQRVVRIVQHDGDRRINATQDDITSWRASTLVIVDGFEQLGWYRRRQLIKDANRRKFQLLITSHRDMGIPRVYQTHVNRSLVVEIVQRLQEGQSIRIDEAEIDLAIVKHDQNLREILFELYDVWNSKKRRGMQNTVQLI